LQIGIAPNIFGSPCTTDVIVSFFTKILMTAVPDIACWVIFVNAGAVNLISEGDIHTPEETLTECVRVLPVGVLKLRMEPLTFRVNRAS